MAEGLTAAGAQYSTPVGLVYVFNLIVGTGALTMPAAFHSAGWLLSLILVVLLAFFSFLTVTFVTEVMGISNAVLRDSPSELKAANKHVQEDRVSDVMPVPSDTGRVTEYEVLYDRNGQSIPVNENENDEKIPLLHHTDKHDSGDIFAIRERIEMGKMAELFFNQVGEKLFYLCIVIYLYGDLSIYAAAVPKSMRDTVCTWRPVNLTICNGTLGDDEICWESFSLTRMDVYRIFVACFLLILGPFAFFNVQKTKHLQIATTLARWLAFGIMIVLAAIRLVQGKGKGHPHLADISGVPNLFGVCVYSFMCHHSLPSLITPIKDKSKLYRVLAADYISILGFYALLSFTGIFTFDSIKDLYTLNFLPDECGNNAVTNLAFFQYFLALFPVFTLSTNFPIISITLHNNLQTMFLRPDKSYHWAILRILFPLAAVLPPIAVAVGTNQVEFLVGITGSYAGTGIQYVIPALLVYYARKDPILSLQTNTYKSPFSHLAWVIIVLVWSLLCIVFVSVNHIITHK